MKKVTTLREGVYKLVLENKDMRWVDIVNHFKLEGFKKTIIYDYYKEVQRLVPLIKNRKLGRPAKIALKSNIKKITEYFDHLDHVCQKKMTKKLKCHQSYISLLLKRTTTICCYKI